MKDEEDFALEWLDKRDVYSVTRLETINRVYSYKVTNRTLGKDKTPICIELSKPPLDPIFEEEMKEFRYALLLSKVKMELERTHQNGPACNVSESKDDEGKEIADVAEDERTNAENESNSGDDKNDENDEEVDADEENDEKKDDDDENDDDDSGDDDDDDDNLGYDSESPIIGNTEYIPDRSPAPRSSPPKDNSPRDSSHSMPPPRYSEAIANQVRDDKMEASPRDGKLEASPRELPFVFEHRSSLRKPMLIYPKRGPTLEQLDPENIMHQILNTVRQAELIYQQYLIHREHDSLTLANLCDKVDQLMKTRSQQQPSSSTVDLQEKITHELRRQSDLFEKITKE
ncbi:PREDICTED: uncharacterized protein LOC109174410 [Ipomoea nil]|uniref:uncharacterized protein LOC109174410 n=1 Tax=Ipomoea nil TaxID=35883 RepID=UPI000901BEDE|nr:PREDICTED: uncharacterized protein LOC109174410 [Ipomoea nil]